MVVFFILSLFIIIQPRFPDIRPILTQILCIHCFLRFHWDYLWPKQPNLTLAEIIQVGLLGSVNPTGFLPRNDGNNYWLLNNRLFHFILHLGLYGIHGLCFFHQDLLMHIGSLSEATQPELSLFGQVGLPHPTIYLSILPNPSACGHSSRVLPGFPAAGVPHHSFHSQVS